MQSLNLVIQIDGNYPMQTNPMPPENVQNALFFVSKVQQMVQLLLSRSILQVNDCKGLWLNQAIRHTIDL